ncbi:MAG: hypothetical protein H8D55_02470 [Deltaproteobacteria bacterium]|nr:hypothetical protein [Deltaproteobacteria bacterium]
MKRDFRLMRILLATVLTTLVISSSCSAMDNPTKNKVVGGPCEYRAYVGQAKIVSINRVQPKKAANDSSKEIYDVKFSFHPEQEIEEAYGQVEGKKYQLLLNNSSHPGANFLKRYGIELGKQFDCYLKVITRGTCTPVVFDFPTIDLSDYYRNEK